jgi:hypothetical protein
MTTNGAPRANASLTASLSVPGTFSYAPAAGTILTAGLHTLSTTFTPTDPNYAPVVRTVSLNVLKARPAIAWTAPANMPFGTALGAAHLNARASIDGTYAYSPAAGTMLDAGQRLLSVTFTPADRVNYLTAAASMTIRVDPPSPKLNSTPPFGFVDSPIDGAVDVAGSLAITGWALDDVGVESIEVFRDPLPGESPVELFVGNATLVEGARPDLRTAYSSLPFSSRAGWGYLLLTNMLPNGGNGTYRFHIYARDVDGHQTLLGSRTVTCDNSRATKPFGSIDTPRQGEFVSGTIMNWGWALTPRPGSIALNGSAIDILIDGVVVGHPNTPPGATAGHPGTGAYGLARPDIMAAFPDYANTSTALGYFVLDTTTLSNGPHTIAWVVRDDRGGTEGIGSRYFTVQNMIVADLTTSTSVTGSKPVIRTATDPAPVAASGQVGEPHAGRAAPTPTTPDAATSATSAATGAVAPMPVTTDVAASTTAAPAATIAPIVVDAATPAMQSSAKATPMSAAQAPRATITIDAASVTTGATVTATIANGPADPMDWVALYSGTGPDAVLIEWTFLNGQRTAPETGMAAAVVTFTAPDAPGSYVVRLISNSRSAAVASSRTITVAPQAAPKKNRGAVARLAIPPADSHHSAGL